MTEEKDPLLPERRRPNRADQFVVLLMSAGIWLLILLLGIKAGRLVELVLVLITTFAVISINVLFAFSRWENKTGTKQKATLEGGRVSHEALAAKRKKEDE